jgi:ABC-type branched-subunit amino acid transport system substrate-binding protein
LDKKPDAFHIVGSGQPGFWMIKPAREMGFTGPFISDVPFDVASMIYLMGPEVTTDVISGCMPAMGGNLPAFVDEIKQEWAAKYGEGEPYNTDAFVTYDQAWAFVQVLEKAQSVDPKVVADTFDTLTKAGDIKSIYGDAYMGGAEVLGVNRVLIRPQPLTTVDANAQIEFIKYMPAMPPGS